jgi:hypothetical protein
MGSVEDWTVAYEWPHTAVTETAEYNGFQQAGEAVDLVFLCAFLGNRRPAGQPVFFFGGFFLGRWQKIQAMRL